MRQKILKQVGVLLTVSILLTFLVVSLTMYSKFNGYMHDSVREEAEYIRVAIEETEGDYLNEKISSLKSDNRITLLNTDGTVLYDSLEDASAMGNHGNRPEVKEAEKKGSGEMLRYSETLDKQTFYYAILLEDGKILRVSRSIDSVLGYLQSGITLVAVLVLAIIGIAFFVIQNQTKKLVEPINTMDLEHPLRHVEYEELRPLLMRVHEQNRQIAGQIQELKERHEEYLAITENMKDGLVVASQTEVLSINKAAQELFQVQASDCIRRPISRVSRNKELKKALDGALAGEHIETVLETHGRFYQLLANPVKVTGKTYGAVIMVWDITEKNAAEQMRREFSANVSHELKTPLMSISGYAELIENGMVQPADIPEFASRIHQEANRLTALVQDIIQLSKLEEGTSQMQEEVVDLYELTEDIGATLHHAAKKKDITMKIEGATQEITGVRQILYEMLYNLMDNGIKYNVEHGILWVRMWKTTDKIYWQVEDTGIGIAKEEQERVYERFYRVDKSHSRQTGGTGLGLSICKTIVERLGGEISVSSVVGKGTTFTFTLPYESNQASGDREEQEGNATNANGNPSDTAAMGTFAETSVQDASGSVSGNTEEGCSEGSSADASPSQQTILIAEDEDSNFDLLKAILGRKYRLIRARDGMEAVMSYDEAKPDLILMDIKMPNLDGLEATKIIRELSTTVPIIAQSAYAYQQDQIAAMDVGCNDFIAKPISQAKLKDMINKWLP